MPIVECSSITFFALEEENIKILKKYSNMSEKEEIDIKSLKEGDLVEFTLVETAKGNQAINVKEVNLTVV